MKDSLLNLAAQLNYSVNFQTQNLTINKTKKILVKLRNSKLKSVLNF